MRAVTKGEEVLLVFDVLFALWAESVGIENRRVAETLQHFTDCYHKR